MNHPVYYMYINIGSSLATGEVRNENLNVWTMTAKVYIGNNNTQRSSRVVLAFDGAVACGRENGFRVRLIIHQNLTSSRIQPVVEDSHHCSFIFHFRSVAVITPFIPCPLSVAVITIVSIVSGTEPAMARARVEILYSCQWFKL